MPPARANTPSPRPAVAADTLENRFANKLLGVQVEYTASDIKVSERVSQCDCLHMCALHLVVFCTPVGRRSPHTLTYTEVTSTPNKRNTHTQLALTSSAVGGRINAKKAVAGLTVQMPAGTLNATVTASVAGQQVKQAFSFDIADAISQQGLVPGGVALAGCKLSLRTATRDWYLDCAKGKAKVPEFKVYPRVRRFHM